MSGRDPRGSSRQSDSPTSKFQARRQERQAAERRRQQLADELGIEEDLVALRDRQRGIDVRPTQEGQETAERRVAEQSRFLDPADIDTTINNGRVDVGPTDEGRQRAQGRAADQQRQRLANELDIGTDDVEAEFRDGEVDVGLTDEGEQTLRERVADRSEFLEPGDVEAEIADDGEINVAPTEEGEQRAEERADQEALDRIRGELPSENDLLFAQAGPDVTNTAIDIRNALQGGRIEDRANVGLVTGGGDTINDIPESPIEAVATADPDEAEDLLGIDRDELESAQEEIGELREEFEEDPSEFEEAALEDPSGVVERANFIESGLEEGGLRRSQAREQQDEIASEIAEERDSLTADDLDIRVDPSSGEVQTAIEGVGDPRRGGVEEDFARQQAAEEFDAQTPNVDVEIDDVVLNGGEAQLRDSAQDRLEAQRTQQLNDAENELLSDLDDRTPGVDLTRDDVDFSSDDGEIEATLTDQAADEVEQQQLNDAESDLLSDLDEQTPGVDLTRNDVDFSRDDGEIEATLTDQAAAEVQQQRNSLLPDFDDVEIGQTAQDQESFGQSSVTGIGFEDPLADRQPQGLSVGDTQLLGVGEDFPNDFGELRDLEPGRDEILSTDLPVLRRDVEAAVSATAQDALDINIQRDISRDFSVGLTDEIAERSGIEDNPDSDSGGSAAAAGGGLSAAALAGVAAPEPVSTGTGLAVLGGLTAAGAIGLSQSELDAPTETEIDDAELEVDDPRIDSGELGVGSSRREASELSSTGSLFADGELDVSIQDDLGNPADQPLQTGELVQPQETFRDEDLVIFDEDINDGSTFASEEEFQGRFVERQQDQFEQPELNDVEPFVFPGDPVESSSFGFDGGLDLFEDFGTGTQTTQQPQQQTTIGPPGVGFDSGLDLFGGVDTATQQAQNQASATATTTATATQQQQQQATIDETLQVDESLLADPLSGQSSSQTRTPRGGRPPLPDFDTDNGRDEFDLFEPGFDDAVVEFGVDTLGEIDDDLSSAFD